MVHLVIHKLFWFVHADPKKRMRVNSKIKHMLAKTSEVIVSN